MNRSPILARPLKVAVVGAGISDSPDGRERWAVRAHVPALKALPDLYDVIAVCTTRMGTASAAASRFQIKHAYDSVERMLKESPEIDVVCAAVRPDAHYQVVMAALSAGKHVYCEHPLGVSTVQAQEMRFLAKRRGVRTMVGHEYHYEPAALQMAEMIKEGYIGKPLTFNITYFVANYITPRPSHRMWLFQSAVGGHPGYRSGHSLERVTAVLGQDIVEICADMAVQLPCHTNLETGASIQSDQVDNMSYLLHMGNDIIGTLQVSFTAWFGTGARFEVYGSEGMLMLDTAGLSDWDKKTGLGDPPRGEVKLYGAHADVARMIKDPIAPERLERRFAEIPVDRHCHVAGIDRGRATFLVAQAWRAFAMAIHTGSDASPDFRDELKIHCVWDAAEKSVREKSWVRVDYGRIDGSEIHDKG